MWYIGQDIVCIKTHSQGVVVEGQVYTIKSLSTGCCSIDINVGTHTDAVSSYCPMCGCVYRNYGIYWLSETLFRPLDEIADISELLEELELVQV